MSIKQHRKFPVYTGAASGANIIGPNTIFLTGAAFNVRASSVNIARIVGSVSSAAAVVYLQFFNSATVPADTTVPTLSLAISTVNFDIDLSTVHVQLDTPLSYCISSTQATKTVSAVTTKFDLFIEEYESLPDGLSVAGDYTTLADSLQPWTEAQGPKTLYLVEAIGNIGDAYLMVFAKNANTVSNGDRPIRVLPALVLGDGSALGYFRFGKGGYSPYSQDADKTRRVGCSLFLSTTADVLTNVGGATNAGTFKAYYK